MLNKCYQHLIAVPLIRLLSVPFFVYSTFPLHFCWLNTTVYAAHRPWIDNKNAMTNVFGMELMYIRLTMAVRVRCECVYGYVSFSSTQERHICPNEDSILKIDRYCLHETQWILQMLIVHCLLPLLFFFLFIAFSSIRLVADFEHTDNCNGQRQCNKTKLSSRKWIPLFCSLISGRLLTSSRKKRMMNETHAHRVIWLGR